MLQFYSGTVFLYTCVYVTVLFIEEEEEEEEEEVDPERGGFPSSLSRCHQ